MLKKYIDSGLMFKDTNLKFNNGFCHPEIIIDSEYSIITQGDKDCNYLYGFELKKEGYKRTIMLNDIYAADYKNIVDFVKNFDKYQKILDNKFNRLKYLSNLRDRLDNYIIEESSFSKETTDSLIQKEAEYITSKEILNNIFNGD